MDLRARVTAHATLIEIFGLLIVWMYAAWTFIDPSSYVFGFDTLAYTGPNLSSTFQAWKGFRIPMWESGMFGGVPFLGRLGAQGLYPVHLPFVVLKVNDALDLLAGFHLLIFALGMWTLVRRGLRLPAPAGFVAGAAVLGAGYTAVKMLSYDQLVALAWVPWILFGVEFALRHNRRIASSGPLALFISFLVLGGHPQFIYMTALVACCWVALRFVDQKSLNGIRNIGVAGLLAFATTSLQLVATYFLNAGSAIPSKRTLASLATPGYVLPPTRLAIGVLGDPFSSMPTAVSGTGEALLSIGVTIVALALVGLLAGGHETAVLRWGLGVGAILGTVFAIGSRWFPFRILYNIVPGFGTARVPGRWLFVPLICLPLLAAFGIAALVRRQSAAPRRAAICCALGLVGWLASVVWPFETPIGFTALWWLGGLSIVVGAAFFGRTPKSRLIGLVTVLLFVIVDIAAPLRHLPVMSQRWGTPFTAATAASTNAIANEDGRVYAQTFDTFDDYSYLVRNLRPNTHLFADLRSIDGYDGGQWIQKWWVRSVEALTTGTFALDLTIRSQTRFPIEAKLMRKFGVRYAMVETAVLPSDQQLDGWRGPISRQGTIEIWENPYWLGSGTAYLRSSLPQGTIAESLRAQDENVALVESPDHLIECEGDCFAQGVSRLSKGPESGSFIFNIASDGILAIDEAWSADWKVFVDGIRSKTFPVNGNQLGVYFDAGYHRVEYRYDPEWVPPLLALSALGLLLSILFCGALIGGSVRDWSVRRRSEQ
jgi:hypothetical protein